MKVKIKQHPAQDSKIIKASEGAVGWDIPINEIVSLAPGQKALVCTGIAIQPEEGFYAELVPRSSSGKMGYVLANTIGKIDNDYTGYIKAYIKNVGTSHLVAYPGDYLFQLVFHREINVEPVYDEEFTKTKRSAGGFGSTTKNKDK